MLSRFLLCGWCDVAKLGAKLRGLGSDGHFLAHNLTRPGATFALPLVVIRPNPVLSFRLLLACALCAVAAFANAQPQLPRPKVLPPDLASPLTIDMGTNANFQNAVLAVEKELEVGAFENAKAKLDFLPHRQITLAWDDSKVPLQLRSSFAQARDQVLSAWNVGLGLDIKITSLTATNSPDLKLSFESVLSMPAGTKEPLPIALFFSSAPNTPRLDAVIGLHRGAPLRPSTDVDVSSEVGFAMGQYLGLAETKIPSGVMFQSDSAAPVLMLVAPGERVIASHNFDLAVSLSRDIEAKQKVSPGLAEIFIDPVTLDPGKPQLQGDIAQFSIQVTNRGHAPMQTRLIPDCTCFATTTAQTIPPGGSALYQVEMQTILYAGDVNKQLVMASSDPNRPFISIPVHVFIKPRYRFLTPSGNTILAEGDNTEFSVFLVFEGSIPDIESATLSGVRGHITYEPWTGEMADPELNEPARKRKGYKLAITLDKAVPKGSPYFLGVNVATTDPKIASITGRIYAQNGIVCSPNPLYCGHIAQVQRQFDFILTRPGKPFHVLGLSTDSKYLKVTQTITPGRPWERRVHVVFDGKAPAGDLSANVTIHTDDKTQPTIVEPVSATVG